MVLDKEFYKQGALTLAKELLGKVIVRTVDNVTLRARIVETEAYIGEIDKASHAYNGRRTERTEPLFREGGIAYVFFIYGKYYCFNVISGSEDKGEGVLIRALEPLNEFDYLAKKRFNQSYEELSQAKKRALTNGPSKLCLAFSIDKCDNYKELFKRKDLYIEEGEDKDFDITETTRVGIDYSEEAIYFPWRFYIKGNKYISAK